MAKAEFVNYILPSYLATYFFYNDASHMTDGEIVEVQTFIAREKQVNGFSMFHAVGILNEDEFSYSNDMNAVGGNVSTFSIQVAK